MSEFWRMVDELAELRSQIPEKRREMSGYMRAVRADVKEPVSKNRQELEVTEKKSSGPHSD